MTEEERKLRELLTKESVDAYRIYIIEQCISALQALKDSHEPRRANS